MKVVDAIQASNSYQLKANHNQIKDKHQIKQKIINKMTFLPNNPFRNYLKN